MAMYMVSPAEKMVSQGYHKRRSPMVLREGAEKTRISKFRSLILVFSLFPLPTGKREREMGL
jgi:hypothetical protein